MDAIGIGEHTFLSPLIGSAIGFGVFWLSPTSGVLAMIVAGAATVASNFCSANDIAAQN
jgi:hypothetical protein